MLARNKTEFKKLGLLGGTFDPPHLGHLVLAETAFNRLGLDRVLFLPVGQPTHKTTMTAASHRAAMATLAVQDDPRFVCDRRDIDRAPPHFTVDLLPVIRRDHPGADLWLLLGGDSLRDLADWHRPEYLISLCRLAVLERPGAVIDWAELERAVPGVHQAVDLLDGPQVHVSSTYLRQELARGNDSRYLLPAGVASYAATHHLYQDE